jgi:outer membrane protein
MKKLYLTIGSIALGLTIVAYFSFNRKASMPYVNISEIYNDFEMKKELEKQLENVQQKRSFFLDSLAVQIKAMIPSVESGNNPGLRLKLEQSQREYMLHQKQFEEDNAGAAQKYQEQIWKQLNQYVTDYGDDRGFDYILGADGTGSVMYARKANNITDDVKQYINSRYKGKK